MARSYSITIPAGMGHDANIMLGGPAFSTLCYGSELLIGLHDWRDNADRYTNPTVPDGGWEAHGLTPARVAEITDAMVISDQPLGTPPPASFATLAGSQGVTWGANLPDLPAPGSMATVTKDEFYQTEQEHFPVVRVVQTHVRDNPAHDDLWDLRALFAMQANPFVPAPWVQPLGAHDAYQLTNLIGGPMLVTHDGPTWRNKVASNTWEPGAPGTEALWEEWA